jgi:hypothetical protein
MVMCEGDMVYVFLPCVAFGGCVFHLICPNYCTCFLFLLG